MSKAGENLGVQCEGRTSTGRWSAPCRADAVERIEGQALCKVHAAGKRRSLAHRVKQDAVEVERGQVLAAAKAVAAELSELAGVEVLPQLVLSLSGYYQVPSGRFIVTEAALRELIARVRA